MLYQHMLKRQSFLQKQIKQLEKKLLFYPNDELMIVHNGRYSKWYKNNGSCSVYIPKKERTIAVNLAHKKFYAAQLYDLSQELKILNTFLNRYKNIPHKSQNLLEDPAFVELFSPSASTLNTNQKDWTTEDFPKNTQYPEQLQHKCLSGELLRSKSEVIIANLLFTHHIPYRYECALLLDRLTFYPDFTILNPLTDEIIYWEHFGMMDVPTYCDQTFSKLKQYARHNIIPGHNLITTYETRQNPIDSEQIERLVEDFFKCN